MTQREAIQILAWSLYDFTLEPETATGAIHRKGLVAKALHGSVTIPCKACSDDGETVRGHGWRRDRFGRPIRCETCGGSGKLAFDPYDRQRELRKVGEDSTVAAPPAVRTRKCLHCNGDGRLPSGATCPECKRSGRITPLPELKLAEDDTGEGGGDPWAAAIVERERRGDYTKLERCLWSLAHLSPHRYRGFVRVYIGDPDPDVSEVERRHADEGLSDLERMLPGRLRVDGEVVAAWRARHERALARWTNGSSLERRDMEMLRRYEVEGQSSAVLADTFGFEDTSGVTKALQRARLLRDRERAAERRAS